MIRPAIFILSFSSLMMEVILARVFSITQWNHLSFMVISISLFGFSASGTFLCLMESKKNNIIQLLADDGPVMGLVAAFSCLMVLCFVCLGRIPMDYVRLPLEPVQMIYLFTVFTAFGIPFFIAGLLVSVGFAAQPEKTGWIYFLTMTGSAVGAFSPAVGLSFFGEEKMMLLAAGIPLIVMVLWQSRPPGPETGPGFKTIRKPSLYAIMGLAVVFMALYFMPQAEKWLKVKPSSYKALSQALMLPDTGIVATKTGIRGRLDLVKSPHLRFAPGLSLKYTQAVDAHGFVFRDGDSMFSLYKKDTGNDFPKFMLSRAGYVMVPEPEDILVIPKNGGTAIAGALLSGAPRVVVLEKDPHMAGFLEDHYDIRVVRESPRAFLNRSTNRFDLIHIEAWGSSLPGAGALNQDPLFTVQGIGRCMDRLQQNGVLMVSRKLLLPPSNMIRLWAATRQALVARGVENPGHHLAVLRNWDTFVLMASISPIQQVDPLVRFAENMNFDIVYLPGMKKETANRFNVFDRPFHFNAIDALEKAYQKKEAKQFFSDYTLDVSPQRDSKPFPDRLVKISRLKKLYKSTGRRWYALLVSGEIVVWVVFFEAFLISAALVFIGYVFLKKKEKKGPVAMGLFFFWVGTGFMFTELYYIKQLHILFEDPVISFTLVLSGLLVFSGMGGVLSLKLDEKYLKTMIILLVIVLGITLLCMGPVFRQVLGYAVKWRIAAAFFLMLAPGVLLGFPFAMGMRCLPKTPAQRAFAWSVNGSASVLSSVAAAQIALSLGIFTLLAVAAVAYIFSLFFMKKGGQPV